MQLLPSAEPMLQQIIKTMKKLILFVGLIILFNDLKAQVNDNEKAVIEALQNVHNAVFVTKDSLALEKLFAKEVAYGHSNGKMQNRKESINTACHNHATYKNINASHFDVIINNTTAITRYVLMGTEKNKAGKVTELKLNIMQVWIKINNDWKMIARQSVAIH